ncbi:hypothetical protein KCP71_00970 [Salmonella enterica subsp. enterica]|nr:hypothetical protein KCP71_00970 [Salmonella enterica subsp. enterica]
MVVTIEVYAALKKAQETKGKATVIWPATIKGYGIWATPRKAKHRSPVKMNMDWRALRRDRFNVPVADADLEETAVHYLPGRF